MWNCLNYYGSPQAFTKLIGKLQDKDDNNHINIDISLLYEQFNVFEKLYDKLTDGIGYFKKLSYVALEISNGDTKIAEFSALNRFKKKISNMKKSVSYKSKKKISNMKKSVPDKFKTSSHSKNKNQK